jgi:hypothetical protein
VAHFEPRDLFTYLQGRQIQRIAFTHVARYYWERLEETSRLAHELLPGVALSFARDLEIIAGPKG